MINPEQPQAMTDEAHQAWLAADAADAHMAAQIAAGMNTAERGFRAAAEDVYSFLRSRETLKIAGLVITPGTPQQRPTGGTA